MEAEPVIIASASSSQWGANVPGFLWLDMARELNKAGVISFEPKYASIGGIEDRGIGIPQAGIQSIRQTIERAGLPIIEPANYQEAVADRIAIFREYSSDRNYKAFVNVGGGATIVGPPGIDDMFKSGLQYDAPARAYAVDTVMGYFLQENIPGIHFIGIKKMAERYGLPLMPPEPVPVGNGGIYSSSTYSRLLAFGLAVALFGLTWSSCAQRGSPASGVAIVAAVKALNRWYKHLGHIKKEPNHSFFCYQKLNRDHCSLNCPSASAT